MAGCESVETVQPGHRFNPLFGLSAPLKVIYSSATAAFIPHSLQSLILSIMITIIP